MVLRGEPQRAPTYDPATGATFDGVEFDGRVNRNSGAESTIHGLLAMLALDAHPQAATLAASITGQQCRVCTASRPSRARSRRGGRGHAAVDLDRGGELVGWGVCRGAPAGVGTAGGGGDDGAFVHPVVNPSAGRREPSASSRSRSTWDVVPCSGSLDNGGLRETGVVEAEGLLRPFPR